MRRTRYYEFLARRLPSIRLAVITEPPVHTPPVSCVRVLLYLRECPAWKMSGMQARISWQEPSSRLPKYRGYSCRVDTRRKEEAISIRHHPSCLTLLNRRTLFFPLTPFSQSLYSSYSLPTLLPTLIRHPFRPQKRRRTPSYHLSRLTTLFPRSRITLSWLLPRAASFLTDTPRWKPPSKHAF